jgi:hypothetical protein
MKILIIAEFFAPDSVIGAVRITKFAKYLYSFGHDITVLCSARCIGKRDDALLNELGGIRICHYNNEVEGDDHKKSNRAKPQFYFIKKIVRKLYKETIFSIQYYIKSNKDKNSIISYYMQNLFDENYDIAISTFSPLAAVEAGVEIAKKGRAKLIVDMRDLMDSVNFPYFIRNINKVIQKKIIKYADATLVVSDGQKNLLSQKYDKRGDTIFVINNGYDNINTLAEKISYERELVIAYTGILYGGKRDLSALFEVIREIRAKYKYCFKFVYAGTDAVELRRQMRICGLEDILEDKGVLSRTQAERVQMEADLFLVAAWNTKKEQGQMTGKFYEGIRTGKPILVLMGGDVPNSDLYKLYKRFNYGYCYEKCRDGSKKELYEYVLRMSREKYINGKINYCQSKELENTFKYETLVRKLEKILLEISEK